MFPTYKFDPEFKTMTDKKAIDQLTKSFFRLFTNTENQKPDWKLIYELCIKEAVIIKKSLQSIEVYNLQSFIEPRKKILSNGTLTEFEENETEDETNIIGNIAQRWSKYQKSGYLNGVHFQEYGNKLFQFIKTENGWKISSLVWEDII